MTRIKLCGLSRPCDVEAANGLKPAYVGFVLAPKSRRYVSPDEAAMLKKGLDGDIRAVGVFADESPEAVAALLNGGVLDLAQLHGHEDGAYIRRLRTLTDKPLIQAFRIRDVEDVRAAAASPADHILLDAGAGTGRVFDWSLLACIDRPYFLAGGLNAANVGEAIRRLRPAAVDVSTGIETDGRKDRSKMAAFTAAVRKEDRI